MTTRNSSKVPPSASSALKITAKALAAAVALILTMILLGAAVLGVRDTPPSDSATPAVSVAA